MIRVRIMMISKIFFDLLYHKKTKINETIRDYCLGTFENEMAHTRSWTVYYVIFNFVQNNFVTKSQLWSNMFEYQIANLGFTSLLFGFLKLLVNIATG